MLFFNFIILLLDPDPKKFRIRIRAGSEKVGSVTSLVLTQIVVYRGESSESKYGRTLIHTV